MIEYYSIGGFSSQDKNSELSVLGGCPTKGRPR